MPDRSLYQRMHDVCLSRRPVVFVLSFEDYTTYVAATWRYSYFNGAQVLPRDKFSYMVEDTPDGPLVHML